MNEKNLRELLANYKAGTLDEDSLVDALKNSSVEEFGFASVDHLRELRQGFPEVVYAAGKTKEQLLSIMQSLYARSRGNLIATRASLEQFDFVRAELPMLQYDPIARMICLDRDELIS